VIDASDPGFERQREVTDGVLAEIGAQDVPRLRSSTRSIMSAMPPPRRHGRPSCAPPTRTASS
jgi:hypothetical protein